MRKRASSDTLDSLELLLDTICNTFGAVIFISMLLAVLVTNSASSVPVKTSTQNAAQEYGFTLEELAKDTNKGKSAQKSKPNKKSGKAKYRNPDDTKQTWTGKGRRPAWYVAAIEAGKSPTDLEI